MINLEELGVINAQEQAKLYPDTFEAVSKADLDSIKEKDFVKVCVSGERFWVEVTGIKKDAIEGTVNNLLIRSDEHNLYFGDEVTFNKKHIYQYLES